MRRFGALLAFILAAPLLGGCVYDPYTGAFVPCCNYYGNPYYRYPPSYYPYGYPPGPYMSQPQGPYMSQPQGQPGGYSGEPQPQGQPGGYPGEPQPGQPGAYPSQPPPGQPTPLSRPGAENHPPGGGGLTQRFAAANMTHDGRLTQGQAASGMPMVARNFAAIDVDHQGYVTLPEVRDFAMRQRAELRGQRQPDAQPDQ
jgi:hypothetical protein